MIRLNNLVAAAALLIGSIALAEGPATDCQLLVTNAKSEIQGIAKFSLPELGQNKEPVVVLHAEGLGLVVSYGLGMSQDFSTEQNLSPENLPIHYLTVNQVNQFAESNAGFFAIDRSTRDFDFGTSLLSANRNPTEERHASIRCETIAEKPSAIPEPFKQVTCQYARLDDIGHVLAAIEADPKPTGFHGPAYVDSFYGFAIAGADAEFMIELSNTEYLNAASSGAKVPQGLKFLRHETLIAENLTGSRPTPEMRLSAQCQKVDGRIPVETRSARRMNIKIDGIANELFPIEPIEDRQAFRIQVSVGDFGSSRNTGMLVPRIILPSGRELPFDSYSKTLAFADVPPNELIGTLQIQLMACDANKDLKECIPAYIESAYAELRIMYR